MFCTQCGTQAVPGAKFCASCGTALPISAHLPQQERSTPEQSTETSNQIKPKIKSGPSGVGGWLLLLVIGMLALGPLLGAGRINADFMMAERQYPNLGSLAEWITFKRTTWWAFAVVAAISMYGGWDLVSSRDWSVVNRAKVILWLTGPIASIVLAIVIPLAVFGKTEASDPQFIGAFIASVIAASIWTAYLSKSKRVRNTYRYKTVVNETAPDGTTPLMMAAMLGEVTKINELVAAGADINATDERGWTALMFAASRNESDAAQALLKFDANIAHVNKDNKTASDIAGDRGNEEIVEIIRLHIADGSKPNEALQRDAPQAARP
ncbi:MAG TPA: DUF2569 family protein [Burkholderiaceae bacterium]|nr:DUF2569 family protein [Burkholderiaceae bacterium]